MIEKVVDANWNKDMEEKLALSKGAFHILGSCMIESLYIVASRRSSS